TVSVCDDSEIYGNTAIMLGGGVYNKGTFTMSGGSIYSNSANGEITMGVQTGGKGGGVFNDSTAQAVGNSNGTVELTNVLIDRNMATVSGGGFYLEQNATTTLESCTIQNNTADVAAPGIAFELGAMNFINSCTFGDPNQEPQVV